MFSQGSQVLIRPREPSSMKTVGLISDTHGREIPRRVFEVFEKVDFIVHAGDLEDLSVIDELEQLAPVLAVYGNTDGSDIRKKLPKLNSVEVFDWKIGVIHDPGFGFPFSDIGIEKMRQIAKQNDFNVLVYGHTHSPSIKWEGKNLFINSGSPTRQLPPSIAYHGILTKPTVALLRITKEKIMSEIIRI